MLYTRIIIMMNKMNYEATEQMPLTVSGPLGTRV